MTTPYNDELFNRIVDKITNSSKNAKDAASIIQDEMHKNDFDIKEEFLDADIDQKEKIFTDVLTLMHFWYKQSQITLTCLDDIEELSLGLVATVDYLANNCEQAKRVAERRLSQQKMKNMIPYIEKMLSDTDLDLSKSEEPTEEDIMDKLNELKEIVEDPDEARRVKRIMEEVNDELFPETSM